MYLGCIVGVGRSTVGQYHITYKSVCICQFHNYHIYFLVCVSSVRGKKTDYEKKKGGSTFEGIYKYVCVCVSVCLIIICIFTVQKYYILVQQKYCTSLLSINHQLMLINPICDFYKSFSLPIQLCYIHFTVNN